MSVTIKRINSSQGFASYIENVERYIGVRFSEDYLSRGLIFGMFKNGELVGGYSIIVDGPLRVVESLKHKPERIEHTSDMAEITGLWLDRRFAKKYSIRLWVHMLYGVVRSRKTRFIFAYTLKKDHLKKLYAPIRTVIVYRGKIDKIKGMPEDDYESIEIVRRRDVFLFPFCNPGFVGRRLKSAVKPLLKSPVFSKA